MNNTPINFSLLAEAAAVPNTIHEAHIVLSDTWSFTAALDAEQWARVCRSPIEAWTALLAKHEGHAVPMGSIATVYAGEQPIVELEFDPRWP
jgi:hypothetical protein